MGLKRTDEFRQDAVRIEHIMPQAWETHWPLPDDLTADERKASIQGIGNLTLVSKKLNPSLSNAPWFDIDAEKLGKRSGLNANTMLMINRKLLDDCKQGWSNKAIGARAEQLFVDAKDIWPR
jgi:hypothetical protein